MDVNIWLALPIAGVWTWSWLRFLRRWPGARLRPRLPFRLRALDLALVAYVFIAVQFVGSRRSSSELAVEDVKDWPRLLAALRSAAEEDTPSPAHRIWTGLTPELQTRVRQEEDSSRPELHQEIAHEMQQMLNEKAFYSAADFQSVNLSPSLRQLLEQRPESVSTMQIARLNRIVLEDAFPGLFASKTETMLRTAMLRGALVIVLVPVLLRYLAKVPYYQLGIHCRRAGSFILYGTLQTIALLPLVIAINGLVQLLWPRQTLNPVQDFFFSTSASTSEWLMVLLSAALIAPLQEELLFRSILQTWLVNRVGIIVGILIAATLFGLAHSSSWPDPVPLIVLGFALGLTYQKTRSLWAPVAMHSVFNGLMVFFSSYNPG